MIIHPIEPLYDNNSKILILGSFPSVKSREQGFFYGHPRNRFWRVLAEVFEDVAFLESLEKSGGHAKIPVEEKKAFLLRNQIAVWDVIHSCEITGSSDASIRNVVANDLSRILAEADIREIFVNGKTAEKYYQKYLEEKTGRKAVCLPSTSPANAAWNAGRLVEGWKIVRIK